MHRSIAAVVLVALATLGLAACTASPTPSETGTATVEAGPDGPGDAGQSTEDACALVRDSVVAAAEEFETAGADDPASVVEAMRAAAGRLGETASGSPRSCPLSSRCTARWATCWSPSRTAISISRASSQSSPRRSATRWTISGMCAVNDSSRALPRRVHYHMQNDSAYRGVTA
jgi:hypothetical protein